MVPGDLAHASQPLQLTWGPIARAQGTPASFDPNALTCSNYCHGNAGSVPAPVWNRVDGTQAACGACHGLPPAAPHPTVTGGRPACNGCHAGTVNPDGSIALAGNLHVNGTVELAGTGGCTGCHGDPARTPSAIAPAPPRDTQGNVVTTAAGVGAHQRHLVAGSLRGPIPCTECHVVPGDIAHATQPLQLTWGPIARAGGVTPTFNPASLTCTNHCHGTAAVGGSVPQPLWNVVNGTQAACGACHGLPPPAPHPTVTGGLTACVGCHAATLNPDGSVNVAGGTHVDGVIQATGHGDFSSPAVHGPQFFAYLGGTGINCRSCHGANLDGGIGAILQRVPPRKRLDGFLADQLLVLPRYPEHFHEDDGLQRCCPADPVGSPRRHPGSPHGFQPRVTHGRPPGASHRHDREWSELCKSLPLPDTAIRSRPTLSHIDGANARATVTLAGGSCSPCVGHLRRGLPRDGPVAHLGWRHHRNAMGAMESHRTLVVTSGALPRTCFIRRTGSTTRARLATTPLPPGRSKVVASSTS